MKRAHNPKGLLSLNVTNDGTMDQSYLDTHHAGDRLFPRRPIIIKWMLVVNFPVIEAFRQNLVGRVLACPVGATPLGLPPAPPWVRSYRRSQPRKPASPIGSVTIPFSHPTN
jgi:hypothetical protein